MYPASIEFMAFMYKRGPNRMHRTV